MMSKIGDARESVVLEKERIDKDLQQMWESLQYLKKSVENDATLLQKADFSDLLQHIVADLSPLSQTQDMLLLQQTLQSQENLTVTDLDKIIQEFISVKLEYTANKSLHLTDISLEKYKQLVEHKSSMDALLLTITQAPTLENSVPVAQEQQQDPANEVVNPIAETLDPDVIKAQQNLIDGQISIPEDPSKEESWKNAENKSLWERAKDSSFGLAYIFGANRLSSAKEWISEKWSDFKEWIGWKKKEKKQENDDATTDSSPTSPEVVQPSVDINKNLTEQERLLRNTHIKQSILDTVTVPIPIDYKADKDLLIQKWSPDKVLFDKDSQSIVLWWARLKLNFPQFQMKVDSWVPLLGVVDATVTKVDIQSIKTSGNEFVIEAKGTGSYKWTEQTKDVSVTISKDKFYDLIHPYLDTWTQSYDKSIDINGQKVAIKIETSWSISTEQTAPVEIWWSFGLYQEKAYNSYGSIDKQNLDTTATVSKDMYKEVSTWLQKDRLPPLIREYDGTLDAFSWKSLAVISEHFGTIKDLTDYTFLEKAWNTANTILGSIVDFLSKHEDKKWIGWLASLIKKPFDVVLSWIPNGDEQKEKKFKENIQKEISGNADIQKDVDVFVKQLTLARFYFIEKKKIMAQDPENKDSLDGLTIAQAMQYLSSKNMLDAKISVKTQLGIDANKAAIVIQKLIAETGPSNQDLSAKRWEIRFNYEKQQLESRWKATPLEVNANGTQYKIKWLDLQFASLEEVVWLANLSNRFISDTSKMQVLRNKKSDRFVYYSNIWRPGYPGLYVNKESDNFFNILPSLDADRVLTAGALQENIKHRTSDMWNTYASYMNERVSSIKEVWL